ncbi:MAG: FtsH protease activity modulator HflK [Deltaproteobacteria bacterium]|nr:FtsH protease activity modulator HflK [Deltaproteobacteria bacterium]
MNKKIRTSLIAISITLSLTILKFIFYYLSGSIAVLSEAWHSFSDISTSVLVLFALWRSASVLRQKQAQPEYETPDDPGKNKLKRFLKNIFGENIEVTTSIIIGIVLISISATLIIKVFTTKAILIQKPLLTGIIFLILSLGSYFLFKFLSEVGKSENSAALISDGLHSKGDMVCSSLTGVSLILYYFRFNIDKWVSLAIALMILSFGIEIIINIIIHFYNKNKEFRMQYRFLEILNTVLEKEIYLKFIRGIDNRYSIDILKTRLVIQSVRLLKFSGYVLIALVLFTILYDMGFQVQMNEEAIIERFGKPVTNEALQPGFHFKFPRPIDMVKKEKTKQFQELFLGNISREEQKPLIWGMTHGEEIHFISGDNNFLNPYIIIHYRIKNLYNYYYNISNPQALIEDIAYETIQDVFTTKSFYQIAITYRKEMDQDIEETLQKKLDKMNTGLEVVSVNVKDIHPPIKISESFEEVIAAYQIKEETINLALEYQNSEIPSSRGTAYSNISDAKAYVNEEILKSQGAVTGYRSKLESYKKARSIIRKVLYYNHIADALSKNDKLIIDPRTGKPNLYLKSGEISSIEDWQTEE